MSVPQLIYGSLVVCLVRHIEIAGASSSLARKVIFVSQATNANRTR